MSRKKQVEFFVAAAARWRRYGEAAKTDEDKRRHFTVAADFELRALQLVAK